MKRTVARLAILIRDRAFFVPVWLLSLVVPRSNQIWAFGSWYGLRFTDNTKYLFVYCCHKDVRAIWITKSREVLTQVRELGFEAYYRFSPRGIWYALRAGAYFVDCRIKDINDAAARGAFRVNLWHGIPLKRIERDIEDPNHPVRRGETGGLLRKVYWLIRHPEYSERYDAVISTSQVVSERFGSAFGVPEEKIFLSGYPRNDVFFETWPECAVTSYEAKLVSRVRDIKESGTKILLYMPTFRDWNNNGRRTIPLEWHDLNEVLEKHDGYLLCKLHPVDRGQIPDVQALSRIMVVPTEVDSYVLLKEADALISDYSSVYFDYLLRDRPVVFYAYDLDEYQKFSRTFYDDYETVTPGPRVRSFSQLLDTLEDLLSHYDSHVEGWKAERQAVRETFHLYPGGGSAERLYRQVCRAIQGNVE